MTEAGATCADPGGTYRPHVWLHVRLQRYYGDTMSSEEELVAAADRFKDYYMQVQAVGTCTSCGTGRGIMRYMVGDDAVHAVQAGRQAASTGGCWPEPFSRYQLEAALRGQCGKHGYLLTVLLLQTIGSTVKQ